MKAFLQKTLLVVGSLVFCFLVLELAFKFIAWIQPNQTGPSAVAGLPYENVPHARFWRLDREGGLHYYAQNAFGLRGGPTTLEKPAGTVRIACIGDSVMHGGNVNQDETTPSFLEKFLKEASNRKVETLNFGVTSYGLREYSIQVREKVLAFSPDIVVVGLAMNDYYIHTPESFAGAEKNSGKSRFRERLNNLFKSHFLEFMKKTTGLTGLGDWFRRREILDAASLDRLSKMDFVSDREKEIFKNYCLQNRLPLALYLGGVVEYLREYRNPVRWTENEDFIRDIAAACREKGADVYFFCFPASEQTLRGVTNPMPQAFIAEGVRRNGAESIEVLEAFRRERSAHPEIKLFPRYDNLHMFKEGHQLIARIIADVISNERKRVRNPRA